MTSLVYKHKSYYAVFSIEGKTKWINIWNWNTLRVACLDFPQFCRHLLSSTRSPFKLIWTELSERAMKPASVVEDLYIIKDI